VVNRRAVEWAAENTNKMVTLVTEETKAALREVISRGIAEGKSIPQMARAIRATQGVGLNAPQMRALVNFSNKVYERYSEMRGGLTPARQARVLKAVQREAAKKLRYRAEMIARTETSRAMSAGTLGGYEEAGIEMVRFDASADACLECGWRDGDKYTRLEAEGEIPVHPNCALDKNLPVYTSKGWVPIGKIGKGDLVLTHVGRFRSVIEIHCNKAVSVEVVKLKTGPGTRGRLRMTADHPILVGGYWVAMRDVRVGDVVRVLARRCAYCETLIPDHRKVCSRACLNRHNRLIYGSAMTDAAHAAVRGKPGKPRPSMRGLNNPAKRPEVQRKISESKKGDKNPMRRYPDLAIKHSKKLRKLFAEHPEKHPNAILAKKARNRTNDSRTWIERTMGSALSDVGIGYATYQYPIGSLWLDYAFPGQKLGVECDGEFWHKDKEKEAERQTRLKEAGWDVLHFTGSQIKADAHGCAEEVDRMLKNHSAQYKYIDVEVVSVDHYVTKKSVMLYNLSVEEDESYIAKGFIVHNCRCTWVAEITGPRSG